MHFYFTELELFYTASFVPIEYFHLFHLILILFILLLFFSFIQQHVNQDTNWDVPTSPEPALTKDGVPMWKPPVNNGTDLWEANLRNGGQPPPPQQAKTPWGHTPSTNIGGTWGEDDDTADSSNMWTGAPAPAQPNTAQWPGATSNQASKFHSIVRMSCGRSYVFICEFMYLRSFLSKDPVRECLQKKVTPLARSFIIV